ncbi:MAG: hypothetical protein ACREAZ_10185, partial [Nitrososphaera sp.]
QHPDEVGGKKNSAQRQTPALPTHYKPRGSPAGAAPRPILHHHIATAYRGRFVFAAISDGSVRFGGVCIH